MSIREYMTESKGIAKHYTVTLDELIRDFDLLIKSIETESPKYLEEKDLKEAKRIIKSCERYVELIIADMNKIVELFSKGKKLVDFTDITPKT